MFRKNLIPAWIGILVLFGVLTMGASPSGCVKYPAPVLKTGQTDCWDNTGMPTTCTGTGQDGALQKGYAYSGTRWTDNANGTITDNVTGLIWTKNVELAGQPGVDWNTALSLCNNLAAGQIGLTDGSKAGDWRLPNINELISTYDNWSRLPASVLCTSTFTSNPIGSCNDPLATGVFWSSTTSGVNGDPGTNCPQRTHPYPNGCPTQSAYYIDPTYPEIGTGYWDYCQTPPIEYEDKAIANDAHYHVECVRGGV